MPSFFDLHVHTTKGSGDSSLTPEELVSEAVRVGLTGVTLTEHGGWSDLRQFREFARSQKIVLVHAREFETEYGHILTYGLDESPPGAMEARALRRAADRVGGYMVVAHPFRNLFNRPPYNQNLLFRDPSRRPRTPQEALDHPLFDLLDDVEALNGGNTEEENRFALEVARWREKPGTGGSDAHSTHGLGRGATMFPDELRSEAEFLEALRAGVYTPVEGLNRGDPRPFVLPRPFGSTQGRQDPDRPFSAGDGAVGPAGLHPGPAGDR
jgi:predicted metal-dependent phosphoesterase TrpH